MRSQQKMLAFSSNFVGDKTFRKLNGSADFRENHLKFYGNYVFYLK